jgi:transcriptional regulator with XRE-family HTH domain
VPRRERWTWSAGELAAWLLKHRLTPATLAVRLDVSRGAVSRWLSGERPISRLVWRALRDVAAELDRERADRRRRRRDKREERDA